MDKATAQRIVRDTFKAPFDRERYRRFISELCNGFDGSKAHNMKVPDAFAAHIKSCWRLGTFTSPDAELADVLIVHLTESYKLERTRTALRDFVAHKLKRGEGHDNAYKEAGFVAFVAPDSQSWRFSYVRMDYETRRDPKTGKIKTEERLTPARRYSYLVGVDEECHTAQTRFMALLQNTTDQPTLAQIEEAFSVESVTKEFFNEYARLFKITDEALTQELNHHPKIGADFEAKGISTVDFAKKLLGQIVFLYFIQKKGWLGVPESGNWGEGPCNFLRLLANKAVENGQCLFNTVLEPLFYDTLATDRGHAAWCDHFQCRIPFLNGGLFEPLAGYDWGNSAITLPNTILTNGEGTGILDVFDRYNFTVNEAEPLEKEVAIDPEMLGKVFENLIEDNRRKGLGAFYTPREIVHYMCQESLINYLDTGLVERASSPLPEHGQDIDAAFLAEFDPFRDMRIHQKNLPHWEQKNATYFVTFRLADSLPQNKLDQLKAHRDEWLACHKTPLCEADKIEYNRLFSGKVDEWLDSGMGSCLLQDERCAEVVANALKYFDGDRYHLGNWVVMPNHVHVIFTPLAGNQLSEILHSWKSYSANKINQLVQKTGCVWQQEYYDHIVRDKSELPRIAQYIDANPEKAGIKLSPVACSDVKRASSPLPKHGQDARATPSRNDLAAWIRQSDQFAHYAAAMTAGTKGAHYPKLPESIRQYASEIDALLQDITVCDPAIGSGAFPVGMMTEIVRARAALTPYLNDNKAPSPLVGEGWGGGSEPRTAYHFKRHAIQNSLYGVDIDSGAVEIAKLRLWLSLVVDEEDVQQIKPLPNLDYKVVVGNSLLGVEKNLFNDEQFKQLEALKPKFFDESDRTKKAHFKQQIEALIHDLTKGREVFDFEIYFSEVFHTKSGFDVVIGNPPYVRQEEIKALKPLLKHYECGTGTADLFVYFYERGVKLLRNGGQFAFITSNKWYRSGYGEKLRGWLARNTRIHELIDFGDAPVFEAIAYPTIVRLERVAQSEHNPETSFRALTWQPGPPLADFVAIVRQQSFEIPQRSLDQSGWRLEGAAKRKLLEKLRAAGTPLGEYCKGRFYYGIKTGLNDAFVVDRATRDRLIAEHPSSAEVLKPFLRGRDVKRWRVDFAEQYLVKIESSENKTHPWSEKSAKDAENLYAVTYPAIHSFHQQFRAGLIKRADQGKYFWELRSCAYWQEFEQPKIILGRFMNKSTFAFDRNRYYHNDALYMIAGADEFVVAILNSSVSWYFLAQICTDLQNGYLQAFRENLFQIPIPAATPADQAELEALVQCILENPNAGDVAAQEAEINERVYRLFGLTREEIKLIEAD
ncbi:MAG: Eco57I restriction-modification methylase domain-containing protein [Candidatus Competibacteraceae bacterium]|nr:Eco57I restriction-modification methylase domain-containing protein [Candidatus Competibacteraceae bacterium]